MIKNCSMLKNMMFYIAIQLVLVSCASTKEPTEETAEQKKAAIYYQQGTEELISKNYSNALKYLLLANDLNPNDDKIKNNLGMAYYLKKQTAKAQTEIQKAISINPKNSDARNNLASIYLAQKKYKEALKEYQKVIEDLTYNKMFRVYYNVALIHKYENRDEQTLEFLNKSIADNSDYCPAHFELGNYYTQKYKFKDALNAYNEATKGTCVTEPASHYEVAMTLIRLNRIGEAEIKFKDILEKFPKTNFAILAREEINKLQDERQISRKSNHKIKSSDNSDDINDGQFETPQF